MAFILYVLECSDGSLYIGHTDNLDLRLQQHDGGCDGYTASRRPVTLRHVEEFESRYDALTMERRIRVGAGRKSWPGSRVIGSTYPHLPEGGTDISVGPVTDRSDPSNGAIRAHPDPLFAGSVAPSATTGPSSGPIAHPLHRSP